MPIEMTHPARPAAEASAPLPDLVLYTRDGCGLCAEARTLLDALLRERAAAGHSVPTLVERDIAANPDWERQYFATIPVVELGDRRLELATSAAKLRRFLADALAAAPSSATNGA